MKEEALRLIDELLGEVENEYYDDATVTVSTIKQLLVDLILED